MRSKFLGLFLFALGCAGVAEAGVNVADMKSWTIVVSDGASVSEKFAATEFQSLFKSATNLDLPIASNPPGKNGIVLIGPGASKLRTDDLGEEGLRIKIKRGSIAIAGGAPRGTLYGVYEFFERYFGVRFLTFDDTYFPPAGEVKSLPSGNVKYIPSFSFRWNYYKENSDHHEFATRLRINTVSTEEKLGGATRQSLINHSLMRWLSPAEFGQSHPEYFAMVNGERKLDVGGGGPEPCVTNPEVLDIVSERVIKDLDANPNVQNISVSQNDNDSYCHCPKCEEINKREGTPMGSHLIFIDAVAERVAKKYPNVKIGTLAYWYTRKAPKTIRPRDNMQIQLCSIECCTLHAINDPHCRKNKEFCKDMSAWKSMSKDIWVWNYNTNFSCYDMPFPNLRSIGKNVEFFKKNNVKGVFMQANGNGTSGEMSDLRNYVMARCLWKPGQESWPLVEEFCRLHYKNAAGPILEYLTMLHDNAEKKNVHPTCFPNAEQSGLDEEVAWKAFHLFEDALAKADDDVVRARVEKASICAYKAMILSGSGAWKVEDGFCRRMWPHEAPQDLTDRYIALCRKYGMTMANEGTAAETYFERLKLQNALHASVLENDVWRLTFLPEENGKLVEMLHKPTGRNLFAAMKHADILSGTQQEAGVQGFEHEKPAKFDVEIKDNAAVFTKTMEDGAIIRRVVTLLNDGSDKIRYEWTLSQKGAEPKMRQAKARPEFDPGTTSEDPEKISVYVNDNGWSSINDDWKTNKAACQEKFSKSKGGGVAFFNHESKFGMRIDYDPAQIDHPELAWKPERPQLNLELYTPAKELKTDETLSLTYEFQYLQEPPK